MQALLAASVLAGSAAHAGITIPVAIGTVRVAVLNQDGGGLGASDLSLALEDLFSSQYLERSDFDGDGALGAADLSILLAAYFAGGSAQGCSTACP